MMLYSWRFLLMGKWRRPGELAGLAVLALALLRLLPHGFAADRGCWVVRLSQLAALLRRWWVCWRRQTNGADQMQLAGEPEDSKTSSEE